MHFSDPAGCRRQPPTEHVHTPSRSRASSILTYLKPVDVQMSILSPNIDSAAESVDAGDTLNANKSGDMALNNNASVSSNVMDFLCVFIFIGVDLFSIIMIFNKPSKARKYEAWSP